MRNTQSATDLVLGGTAGIGHAYAMTCANAGHAVYLVARDAAGLSAAATRLGAAGASDVQFCAGDLNDAEFRSSLRTALNAKGLLPLRSILIGGPSPPAGTLNQVTLGDMDAGYDICVRYPLEIMRWALEGALAVGGEVIVVSSSVSKEPVPGTRFAVSALFRRTLDELANELQTRFETSGRTLVIWRPRVVVTRLSLAYAQRLSGAVNMLDQIEFLRRLFDVARVPTAAEFVAAHRIQRRLI